jgi:hypothetical protein
MSGMDPKFAAEIQRIATQKLEGNEDAGAVMGSIVYGLVLQLQADMKQNEWTHVIGIDSLIQAISKRNLTSLRAHVEEKAVEFRKDRNTAVFARLKEKPYVSTRHFQRFGRDFLDCNPIEEQLQFRGDRSRMSHRGRGRL